MNIQHRKSYEILADHGEDEMKIANTHLDWMQSGLQFATFLQSDERKHFVFTCTALWPKSAWIEALWEQKVCSRINEGKKDSNLKKISNNNFCQEHFIGGVIPFVWKTVTENSVINF